MTLLHQQHLLALTLINKPTRLQGSSLESKPILKNKNQIFMSIRRQFTSLFSSLKKNFNPSLHSNNQVKFTHSFLTFLQAYLIPNMRSIRKPPKKHKITLGQEYQAYSSMNFVVFTCMSQIGRKKKKFSHTGSAINKSKQNMATAVFLYRASFLTIYELFTSLRL